MVGYIVFFCLFFAIHYWVKDKKKLLLCIFVVITLFSAIRYGIGYDYYTYLECCMPGSYRGEHFEPIPFFFVELSQEYFPFLFFILSSVFISFFYYLAIRNEGRDYSLEILFYICFPFLFFNQLGIVRQAMASSVVFYALTLNGNYRIVILKRLLLIFIAYCCHHSAVVALLMLIPWQRVPRSFLWLMLIASFFLGLITTSFANQIAESGFLDEDSSERALKYLNSSGQTEGNIIKYLIYIVTIVSLFFYKKLTEINKRNAYYIGLLVLGASLFSLFDYNVSIAKRSCMFFFSVSIFIVPQVAKTMKISNSLYICICLLLLVANIYVGSFNVRDEDRDGESVTYPYRTYIFNYL